MNLSDLAVFPVRLVLYATFGTALGLLMGDLARVLMPVAPRRSETHVAVYMVIFVLSLVLAALFFDGVLDSWTVGAIGVFATGVVLGVVLQSKVVDTESDKIGDLISNTELGGPKLSTDRWLLVTGEPGAGKTGIVEQMVHTAMTSGLSPVRPLGGPVRYTDDRRVVELDFSTATVTRRLWIWESSSLSEPRFKSQQFVDKFDSFVLVADPTKQARLQQTFAPSIRDVGDVGDVGDSNTEALILAGRFKNGGDRFAWAAISKVDLLRFSVSPDLMEFPLTIGPGWHAELSGLEILERHQLVNALGLNQLTSNIPTGLPWGTDSPFLTYSQRHQGIPSKTFGGPEILSRLVKTLIATGW